MPELVYVGGGAITDTDISLVQGVQTTRHYVHAVDRLLARHKHISPARFVYRVAILTMLQFIVIGVIESSNPSMLWMMAQ